MLAVAATLAVALTFQLLTSPPDVLVSALDLDRPHGGGGSVLSAWRQTKPARPDAEDAEPDGALLVTAYFPFDSAKHGQEEYDAWMRLFLATMRADVYMFCPAHVAAKVRPAAYGVVRLIIKIFCAGKGYARCTAARARYDVDEPARHPTTRESGAAGAARGATRPGPREGVSQRGSVRRLGRQGARTQHLLYFRC